MLPNVSHSTDAIDMPVDPNEPTYCLCNQVSYGEMIGCDNPDVSLVTGLISFFCADRKLMINFVVVSY